MSNRRDDLHNDAGVRLTVVPSEAEAAILQATLQAEGISCQITGDTVGTTLNYYGSAVCRVEILVHASKLEEARGVLKEYEERKRSQSHVEWICSRCQEVNAGTFEACWSCQKLRDESDQEYEEPQPWSPGSPGTDNNGAGGSASTLDSSNPYAPPTIADRSSPALTLGIEDTVRRLRRGAILGSVIWPVAVLMLFVSLQVFLQIARGQLVVSRPQHRKIQLYSLLIFLEAVGYPLILVIL